MIHIAKLIAELRVLVGYLGEKHQAGWWASEFYSPTAAAFLAPIFNRSLFQAQYQGATAAAAKAHDETIGVGRIFHLFRFPIGHEQAAADSLLDEGFVNGIRAHLQSREQALARLAQLTKKPEDATAGPMAVGEMADDLTPLLHRSAALYHSAFSVGIKTFPFIREVG
jgi:hypothetical protein